MVKIFGYGGKYGQDFRLNFRRLCMETLPWWWCRRSRSAGEATEME
jgi:hypothetical protein